MTDTQRQLRRVAHLAHLAHALTLARLVVALGLITLARMGPPPLALERVSMGLGAIVASLVATAGLAAARAGLLRAATRVGVALGLWAAVTVTDMLSASTPGQAHALANMASMAVNLTAIAWCALLGDAVRAAGAPSPARFRALAYAAMSAHVVVQLVPSLMFSLGATAVAILAIGATVFALGAAATDALRLGQALPGDTPPESPALAEADARRPDDPWRPGT